MLKARFWSLKCRFGLTCPVSDSVKRHLSRRHLSVLSFCSILFSMVAALAKKKSAFTKAASIPAWRQSENAGPRLFWIYFSALPPHLEDFFQFFELSTKAVFEHSPTVSGLEKRKSKTRSQKPQRLSKLRLKEDYLLMVCTTRIT